MADAKHADDCDYHLDQYPWECTCGGVKASRRGFLAGLGAVIAAPAIVKADRIMRVRGIVIPVRKPIALPPTWGIIEWAEHHAYLPGDVVHYRGQPYLANHSHVAGPRFDQRKWLAFEWQKPKASYINPLVN